MIFVLLRGLLAAFALGFLPGWLLERAWFGRVTPVAGLEQLVMRVVVSVLLSGWFAFLLAELGVFHAVLLVALVGLCCGVCWVVGRRRRGEQILLRPMPRSDWLLALVGVVFAILVARPFEVIRGGLDAGVYTLTGYAIARTGGIVQDDALARDIGARAATDVDALHVLNQLFVGGNPERYLATKQRAQGFKLITDDIAQGRVVPQFFHLWPTWIAVGTAIGTPYTGLLATGVAALLGVLLVGLLGRRLAGAWVGVFAAACLALSTPQVWFGRMPTSEALAQALTFAGLWSFAHFAAAPAGQTGRWWGLLAGAAFGQLALTRIDGALVWGPVLAYLLYVALTRRWRNGHTWLAGTLGVLLFHSLLHTLFIARAYFFDTAYARLQDFALTTYASMPFVTEKIREVFANRTGTKIANPRNLVFELCALAVGLGLLWYLARRPRLLLAVETLVVRRQRSLLRVLVVALGLFAAYAYLIRPQILTANTIGQLGDPQTQLQLQGYVGAPIDVPTTLNPLQSSVRGLRQTIGLAVPEFKETSQYSNATTALSQANMVRFGWYLSPLGILLGLWGGLRWWRRGLNRCSWLLLILATVATFTYLRQLYGTSDQTYIYILRRYVPLVYPAWMLAMAYGLWGAQRTEHREQRTENSRRFVLCSLFSVLLLLFFAWTGRNVYQHVEYGNSFSQFAALAERIGPDDIVLVRTAHERDQADIPAAPLSYLYGRNALTFKGAEPTPYAAALADQVERWRAAGREVYLLLGASSGDWQLPGWGVVPVDDWTWRYREYEQPQDHKPSQAGPEQALTLRLYHVVPASEGERPTVITPNDTAYQVRGLYRAEETPAGRAAWTTANTILRLPGSAGGNQLLLDLGSGTRPQAIGPARVCLGVAPELATTDAPAWRELGCQAVSGPRSTVRWRLDPALASQPLLVHLNLTAAAWVPSQTTMDPGDPPSTDGRTLGVQFFGARRE